MMGSWVESIFKAYECVTGILWESSCLYITNIYIPQSSHFWSYFLAAVISWGNESSNLKNICFSQLWMLENNL